jgi:hypothetical protein
MSDPSKYPKFIWVVVALVLVAVVGYALISKQPVQEIQFPGGGVKFGPGTKDETVRFYVSYEREGNLVLEGQAVLYLAGSAQPLTLSVGRGKPFHTANVTVPRPGSYAYRLEQIELHRYQQDGRDVAMRVAMQGEGKIDVNPGTAFSITRILQAASDGGTWFTALRGIHSEEEKRKIEDRAAKALDKLIEQGR